MIRHGIVVPLPGLGPPPECKGGPAFCAVCNAEMIALELRAFHLAFTYERLSALSRSEPDFSLDQMEAVWRRRAYHRNYFRKIAASSSDGSVQLRRRANYARRTPEQKARDKEKDHARYLRRVARKRAAETAKIGSVLS